MDADIAGQIVAKRFAAGPARTTVSADQVEVGDNDPTNEGMVDAVAHLDYPARQLVTGDPWQQGRVGAKISVDAVEHRQPDPAGQDLDEDFPGPGRRDRKRGPGRILAPREHSISGLFDHCYLLALPDSISGYEGTVERRGFCMGFSRLYCSKVHTHQEVSGDRCCRNRHI
jgi:hypothetical protein